MQQNQSTAAEARLKALQQREQELHLLQQVSTALLTVTDRKMLQRFFNEKLKDVLQYGQAAICVTDTAEKEYNVFYYTDDKTFALLAGDTIGINEGFFSEALNAVDPLTVSLSGKAKQPLFIEKTIASGMKEAVILPLYFQKENPSVLYLFFNKPGRLTREALRLVKGLALQFSLTVSNILLAEKLQKYGTNSLESVSIRIFTDSSSDNRTGIDAIIGTSPATLHIKELVATVAPTPSGVLLLGESGTGKEVVAYAIHSASAQSGKTMVKVNCAAIPANLLESELFGHEKGAFTGAIEKRTGKFQQAHNSTIFLDEIGEMPLALQTKLLRVLQENEFEPIGSSKTIKVNVRVIAATNRNLLQEVAEGRFRADLFYRLNVFPITLPPLRERKEDIAELSNFFITEYCATNNRKPLTLSVKVQEAMLLYRWPGNIRELKHLLERSVLLATTSTITEIEFPETKFTTTTNEAELEIRPLQEIEKEYILKAIKLCNGRISGPNGAAVRLGLPHTTLISKMQKLGIHKSVGITSGK